MGLQAEVIYPRQRNQHTIYEKGALEIRGSSGGKIEGRREALRGENEGYN
jgi:hypothetical protein